MRPRVYVSLCHSLAVVAILLAANVNADSESEQSIDSLIPAASSQSSHFDASSSVGKSIDSVGVIGGFVSQIDTVAFSEVTASTDSHPTNDPYQDAEPSSEVHEFHEAHIDSLITIHPEPLTQFTSSESLDPASVESASQDSGSPNSDSHETTLGSTSPTSTSLGSTSFDSTSLDSTSIDSTILSTSLSTASSTVSPNFALLDLNPSSALSIASPSASLISTSSSSPAMPSPLLEPDETKFLSFEEWKEANLINRVQSAQLADKGSQDAEISLVKPEQTSSAEFEEPGLEFVDMFQTSGTPVESDESNEILYKQRFNYASFECAATIMKTNANTKGAANILNENKDTYLLNECSESNKFVVIEMCQDILVDTLVIANYEFFSSMFRHFRITVADQFPAPPSDWKVLGEFEARSVRDIQEFHIDNPLIWARYLRIEFLSHWGHEFYCPVSLVRIHGTTMMEEYRNQEKAGTTPGSSEASRDKLSEEEELLLLLYSQQAMMANDTGSHPEADKQEDLCITEPWEDVHADIYEAMVRSPQFISPLVLNESCSWDEYMSEPELVNIPANSTSAPKTQDSIYQTILKRLSLLESNSTLSLQYIEAQSQNLRDLLFKIEGKQTSRIEAFFQEFNNTVTSQLRLFQVQYSRLLLSTVEEMESQKRRSDQDMVALGARMTLLADELTYQKKLSIAQAVILLTILVFVITTRSTPMDPYAVNRTGLSSLWASPVQTPGRRHSHRVSSSSQVSEVEEDTDHEDDVDEAEVEAETSSVPRSQVPRRVLLKPLRTSSGESRETRDSREGPAVVLAGS